MRGLWPLLLLARLAAALAIWTPSRQYLEGRLYNNIGSAYARRILQGSDPPGSTWQIFADCHQRNGNSGARVAWSVGTVAAVRAAAAIRKPRRRAG